MYGVSFSFWKATEHHPHQQAQQSSRLVGLLFVFILGCLFLMYVFSSVGGARGEGGSLNVSFYNHRFCMFWYM
jgi:hypothetical protein